uniref:Serine/arginine-rich splicing factor SR45a n=1 Tax=Strongyloides papillosus TaxID=174720 RepID=A0A0N5BTT2_STREA
MPGGIASQLMPHRPYGGSRGVRRRQISLGNPVERSRSRSRSRSSSRGRSRSRSRERHSNPDTYMQKLYRSNMDRGHRHKL